MARVIAIYLPQFHPIPENDKWWGKGFTEWTNVGNAKPLFKGHYQPRVPADLGYYDLRLPETREAQAQMAKDHGIEGFCYWHYYFGSGKRLLERPFNEVLSSGKPDFPFCLGWANHSWSDKQFSKEGKNKLLIAQTYGGVDDYTEHFYKILPAFQDKRYIKVKNKPLFFIYDPYDIPDPEIFIDLWQNLAKKNGLDGLFFVANTYYVNQLEDLKERLKFDAVAPVRLFDVFKKEYSLFHRAYVKLMRVVFKTGRILLYSACAPYFHGKEDALDYVFPSIYPSWDHSPRSGRQGHILHNANPDDFQIHVENVAQMVKEKSKDDQIIFLRSWNEWAEGNYIEPDLKYGLSFLKALKNVLDKYRKSGNDL